MYLPVPATENSTSRGIGTILKHDRKVTSYKLALVRALNDVVLSFPDVDADGHYIAVPLRILAEYWLAYYWLFGDPRAPILQGPQALRAGALAIDMAFRPAVRPRAPRNPQTRLSVLLLYAPPDPRDAWDAVCADAG